MDTIAQIGTWLVENWAGVITALGTIIIAARAIVILTPTPKDDSVLDKVVEVLKAIGLHVK